MTYQVFTHIAVDSRFRPYLLCKDSVDLRGSLRGLGDCGDISRGFLGRKIIERIDCADCGDIVKGSMRNGHSFCVPRLWNIMIQRALGRKEGRIVRKSRHRVLVVGSLLVSKVSWLVVRN